MHAHRSIDELKVLNDCHRAHGAGYKHGNRNSCLKGTRETVLHKIECWTRDFEQPPVYWLNGLAGVGKSTIAQTITEQVFADGNLGASFFCSRDVANQSNLQLIFPTLAFQLAQNYPTFRSFLVPLLQSNPDIVHESLQAQMQKLIVEPLLFTKVSTVIVVDALDECKGKSSQSAFLHVLGRLASKLTGVKFFITSRPEKVILSGFNTQALQGLTNIFVLHMVDRSVVDHDIRLYCPCLYSNVMKLRVGHQMSSLVHWFEGQLVSLCMLLQQSSSSTMRSDVLQTNSM